MIKINIKNNAVEFVFTDSQHYLENGTIEVPVNSLALIVDESDMVTFRRADSDDLLFSANISEFGMSKDALINLYKNSMVGATGGGGGGSVDAYTKTETNELLDKKQNKLRGNYVSNVNVGESSITLSEDSFGSDGSPSINVVNFKSINGNNIIGNGDIKISAGGGGSSAKEWKVNNIQVVNNSELPFYEVNVGDAIITTAQTATGQSEDETKYLVIYKYESPEDATNPWTSNNYLGLIDARSRQFIQLSISVYNATQGGDWANYTVNQSNIGGGGTNITSQSSSNGSSSNYIWSEGSSASTNNRNAISKIGVGSTFNNGVNINTYYWGSDKIGQAVTIPKANPWGGDGVMSCDDKKKLDSIDTDNLQEKLVAGDNITIEGNVISATGGGGGSVDAYTKTESDERYAPKSEFASVSGDVENALGEIAALGIDKQDKLSATYLSSIDVGGSSLSIETKAFKDQSVQKTDNINFKTINGQAIFGMGNIQIEGGSLPNYEVVTGVSNTYATGSNNTPYETLTYDLININTGVSRQQTVQGRHPIMATIDGAAAPYMNKNPFAICVCTQSDYDSATKSPNILYIING